MNSRDFCYWLQGMLELSKPAKLNKEQTELIKKHLNMVFYHEIDPSHGDKEHQGKLTSIHNGATSVVFQDESPTGEVESSTLNSPQLPALPEILLDQLLIADISPFKKHQDIKYRC